ncbi:hypothetical protein AB0G04_18320 [Actinoplanes sp. NPDC023801]|uniref:hypothetical protein n=1 Tax=Actinoplanes sp. NPDC023801 TaxID=3154595 RepID=UPI0033FC2587
MADGERFAGGEAVRARRHLDVEQLQHPAVLRGRRRQSQHPVLVGDEDAGQLHIQELHAPAGEQAYEIPDIDIGDQRVGQLHERLGNRLLP